MKKASKVDFIKFLKELAGDYEVIAPQLGKNQTVDLEPVSDFEKVTFDYINTERSFKRYIYPQSQPKVVICVTLPKIAYQTIELNQPQIVGRAKDDRYLLLLRDVEQKLEITVTVSTEQFQKLLESLKQT